MNSKNRFHPDRLAPLPVMPLQEAEVFLEHYGFVKTNDGLWKHPDDKPIESKRPDLYKYRPTIVSLKGVKDDTLNGEQIDWVQDAVERAVEFKWRPKSQQTSRERKEAAVALSSSTIAENAAKSEESDILANGRASLNGDAILSFAERALQNDKTPRRSR